MTVRERIETEYARQLLGAASGEEYAPGIALALEKLLSAHPTDDAALTWALGDGFLPMSVGATWVVDLAGDAWPHLQPSVMQSALSQLGNHPLTVSRPAAQALGAYLLTRVG